MSRILITGATGFVGKNLVPVLMALGHEVRCAVWQKNDALRAEQIEINKLEEHIDWSEALENIEIVIHLAARVHIMTEERSSLEKFCKVNSTATQKFAQQAAEQGVKRFIFLSSIKVNGEFSTLNNPFTEESPTQPQDPYAQSKLVAEHYLEQINQKTKMQTVILRPPLVYGPGVKANFLKMLDLVQKGWPLPFARILNKRSFLYIDNLISAIILVTEHPKAANQLYLVADNESWSLSELLSTLANAMNSSLKLFDIPFIKFIFKILRLKNLNMRLFSSLELDNSKIKAQLGWEPPIEAQEGLKRTVAWYQNEHSS